jgi:hypothetical protein
MYQSLGDLKFGQIQFDDAPSSSSAPMKNNKKVNDILVEPINGSRNRGRQSEQNKAAGEQPEVNNKPANSRRGFDESNARLAEAHVATSGRATNRRGTVQRRASKLQPISEVTEVSTTCGRADDPSSPKQRAHQGHQPAYQQSLPRHGQQRRDFLVRSGLPASRFQLREKACREHVHCSGQPPPRDPYWEAESNRRQREMRRQVCGRRRRKSPTCSDSVSSKTTYHPEFEQDEAKSDLANNNKPRRHDGGLLMRCCSVQ